MRHPALPVTAPAALAAAVVWSVALAAPAEAQSRRAQLPADSADLVEYVREQQQAFEAYRQSRIPVARQEREGGCDQRIGRICIWFGGEDEADFPEEPTETEMARRGLIGILLEAERRIDHPWVTGQLVHYLVEQRDFTLAERTARSCGLQERWWCDALLGYSLHVRNQFVDAEAAFRDALDAMPDDEYQRWTSLKYIVSIDTEEAVDDLDPQPRTRAWELFWRLSDPLVMVEGNDRLTDHFARLVVARNREEAENPQGLSWERDLEETLVRYGRMVGWSRSQGPRRGGARFELQDTRSVIGHHQPASRGYLFPERFLESPSDIPPESWITAPREAHTWYAPPYAPDMRGLETQVGRFRRVDRMLVVAAYQPEVEAGEESAPARPLDVESALYLVPVEGGPAIRTRGDGARDVVTLTAEPGRYVSSLEVFDDEGRRAWRARQGVKQEPLLPGLVSVSDLLVLREGAPVPTTLQEAIPDVRPGVRIGKDERFTVVWEVYGLQVDQPVDVTVGFTRGRPGFLTRVGEFLGVLDPERPVEITFEDAATDQVQTAFRAVQLELPDDLEPGEYTLHVQLDLPGVDPIIASRPVVVEE